MMTRNECIALAIAFACLTLFICFPKPIEVKAEYIANVLEVGRRHR